ncbi:uncharacterized protein BYT42DRAFT_586137 [Radiomyces spectabilis]|uniref:uncharacterized protein n=1 Tax=Radiomyces spectabilis TaxID=64574 RepID=UPI00221F2A65|nr:uncharacterized protein BYT42DRAFT_586137 [Radiomyces spectabilis]KAI8368317.1 hypothetical protein BYT42DRAFT_586137 [Radiomyces spectabilis]
MLQHPLDPAPHPAEALDSFTTVSHVEEGPTHIPPRVSSPSPDTIVRAASPFGRRYLKPINGIQTKGFARSAQRRSSVLTLGSIERLQHFYAKKELKTNKVGTLGFSATALTEEPDDLDQLPTPKAPPPTWIDLDVETDLDVLLGYCFQDIQSTLATWAMVTGPGHASSATESDSDSESGVFQILPLLHSVTKMLNSVKNYTLHRHDLPDTSLSKLRQSALHLLEAMKILENQHRVDEDDDARSEDGYIYRTSDFNMLEKERQAILDYLCIVEQCAFNPPHHIGSPPAVFTPEIKALMARTSITGTSTPTNEGVHTPQHSAIPVWLERGAFLDNDLARYHALLSDYRRIDSDGSANAQVDIPSPEENEDDFLQFLADGIILCNVYNNIVKRSRRPFGFISKIHQDTRRTYRAIENLRFFAAACKFRFELVFDPFDPAEVARKTDKGLHQLLKAVTIFCDCVIRELRQDVDMARRSLPTRPPIELKISEYMEKKLFIDDAQEDDDTT